jgi:hypothetical protein
MIENEARRMAGTRPCLFVQTYRQIALSSNTRDRPSCFCKTCAVPVDRHIASRSDLLVYNPQNPPLWAKFSTVGPFCGCEWAILEKSTTFGGGTQPIAERPAGRRKIELRGSSATRNCAGEIVNSCLCGAAKLRALT